MRITSYLQLTMITLAATLFCEGSAIAVEPAKVPAACGCQPKAIPPAAAVQEPVQLASCDQCQPGCQPSGCAPAKPACGPACDGGCESGCDVGCTAGCDAGCAADIGCPTDVCTGQCGCDCLRCCDQWTVFAGVVFLSRSDAGSIPLIINQGTGETLLNAQDLDFDPVAAPSVSIIRDYCNCWGWEVGYFGTDAWNSSGRGGGEVSPVLVGPGIDFPSTAPGTIFQADYGSELYSAEFNIRRRCSECVTLLAGFRWLELGDTLHAYTVAPNVTDLLTVDTTNHLYGLQVGADTVLYQATQRVRIDGLFRAGVLGNHIDHSASSPLTGGFGTLASASAEDDTTAFLGSIGLRGVVNLTNNWGVYGGYQLLWLDGVALAPDNIQATSLVPPSSNAIDTGTVFFHGAMVGLQATF
jgi:hypothetical protein